MIEFDQVDADFAYQGEFEGRIGGDGPCHGQVGMQVVALGDGKFNAVGYPGGLPGDGWNGGERIILSGNLEGEIARLAGGSLQVELTGENVLVMGEQGRPLGTLARVQRASPTFGIAPRRNAVVLFDGTHANHFKNGKVTREGWLRVGTEMKDVFRDYHLHIEFRLPYMPHARGQGRSNSGVYLQSRYEVQILDSFGLEGAFNECGALYRTRKPDINMCFPPLSWQTYDIDFTAARFDACGHRICNARVTVIHNGVVVQNAVSLQDKTGAGRPEGPERLPIKLQDHRNPVVFRNIWLVKRYPYVPKSHPKRFRLFRRRRLLRS